MTLHFQKHQLWTYIHSTSFTYFEVFDLYKQKQFRNPFFFGSTTLDNVYWLIKESVSVGCVPPAFIVPEGRVSGGVSYPLDTLPTGYPTRYTEIPDPRRNMEPEIAYHPPQPPPERTWDHGPGWDLAPELSYLPLPPPSPGNRQLPVKT